MKNFKGTQNDWKIDRQFTQDNITKIPDWIVIYSGSSKIAEIETNRNSIETCENNAQLIAAAPELLKQLQRALNMFGRGYEPKAGIDETIGSRLYLDMKKAIDDAVI